MASRQTGKKRHASASSRASKGSDAKKGIAAIEFLGPSDVDSDRVRALNDVSINATAGGPVVYWMEREQRVDDNWSLLYAHRQAVGLHVPLVVAVCLEESLDWVPMRQAGFMLRGLAEVSSQLREHGVELVLLRGPPGATLAAFATEAGASLVVCDQYPLRRPQQERKALVKACPGTAIHEVDGHNIVPVWAASDKIEYAARTIRNRINRQLDRFLVEFPKLALGSGVKSEVKAEKQARAAAAAADDDADDDTDAPDMTLERWDPESRFPAANRKAAEAAGAAAGAAGAGSAAQWASSTFWHPGGTMGLSPDFRAVQQACGADASVPEITWLAPGPKAGRRRLAAFLKGIKAYSQRNDPTKDATSNLSPYLNFGQLSAQRAALEASTLKRAHPEPVASFLEELIVRRELSDNYCFYNPDGYDRLSGLYPQFGNESWAQRTLRDHAEDQREHLYSRDELDQGKTHDELWNAAQKQLVVMGKLHGFMRMYWAKKVLEWTGSPEEGHEVALWLNDRYAVDGNNPNGFVGVAWAVAGVHDQGWRERPVFGKIRYMNAKGCQRKFDVGKYRQKVLTEAAKERRIQQKLFATK